MSQDMFAGFDSDPDEPNEFFLTPTEFSGVSAGTSSHTSPTQSTPTSSQPFVASVASVAPSPMASPSPQVLYSCPSCRSKLKTLPGFKTHLQRHNITGDAADQVIAGACQPPASVVPSTSRATTSQAGGFYCNECKKTLMTEGGYMRHRANHKYSDAISRKPKASDFESILLPTLDKITDEIIAEPSYEGVGDAKKNFLEEFKSKSESAEWMTFVKCLSDKICAVVCDRQKKILPLNQYEESQQKVHAFLCEEETMSDLCLKLESVCHENLPATIARRLVFRFGLKLLWEIQTWVTKETRSRQPTTTSNQPPEMSELEKHAFVENLGEIIRDFYKKCLKSGNHLWLRRSACLCDRFVDGQHPIASSIFLDKELWLTGDEDSIVPSDKTINFFLEVENVVVACAEDNVLQDVIENILGNTSALNLWHHLTSVHFSEEDSLLFMKDIINVFMRRSLLLREKQKNRGEERSARATLAPLRTNLKRNYTATETSESIP